jgi:RNA polymerase sigma factor (sigma-70 family)
MTLLPERRVPPPARPDAHSPSEDDEARLIARTSAGDLRAFELLYRLYHPRLTRFLERMTRRPSLVDELLDDTLMVVWKRASTFNGRSKVSTWIFAIAYRKALKALRRLDDPAVDDDADERPEPGPGPEQRFGEGELRGALVAALAQLSAPQRAVVDLAYFQDLSVREIAEIAACPVDTVKTRMFYARRRLKTLLAAAWEGWR